MEKLDLVSLLGGLAIFLYGMKHMSESLQRAAGENLKTLLQKMTTNKLAAVVSGMTITATIQSSSATTVMLVGFVNAGLVNINQAIGVIMGANIGTTLTAWIVAFLGFKFKISNFALPAISLGVVMLFSKRDKIVVWGNTLIGFGLLFLGLHFLKSGIPDYKSNPEAFAFLNAYADMGFLSVIIFVGIGTLLTVIVQSSSTSTAITITLAVKGYITPDLAMAMILGENIGTTITANLAALAGNRNAKKAAVAHTLFNLIGVIWALFLFTTVAEILKNAFGPESLADRTNLGYLLSIFHTGFNVTNTFILLWFVPYIARAASETIDFLLGKEKETREKSSFKLLTGGSVNSSELSLLEITSYNAQILKKALKNFKKVKALILEEYSEKKVRKILESEELLDKHRSDMLHYMNEIQKTGVTGKTASTLLVITERVRTLEQIGDNFADIAKKIRRAHKNNVSIPDENDKPLIADYLSLLKDHYKLTRHVTAENNTNDKLACSQSENMRDNSRKLLKELEKKLHKRVSGPKTGPKKSVLYLILMTDLIHLMDNISRCLNEMVTLGSE